VLEVDALSPLDEGERRLAVEVEVPEVAQQPYVLPVADARQERVHEHDLVDLVAILRRVGVGHHQTDVVSHERDLPVAQPAHEAVDVPRQGLLVVAARGSGRSPRTAQVRGDHGVRRPEHGQQGVPHVARLRVAVQQHDHRPLPTGRVAEGHAPPLRRVLHG
jgi:hypothetical protein